MYYNLFWIASAVHPIDFRHWYLSRFFYIIRTHICALTVPDVRAPMSVKRQALQLYLEGLGFRSIGRF